jgi:hypothetical protein
LTGVTGVVGTDAVSVGASEDDLEDAVPDLRADEVVEEDSEVFAAVAVAGGVTGALFVVALVLVW